MTASELQPLINGNRSKPVPSVIPSGRDQLPDISTLQSLQKVYPEAVFFTTIPKLDPEETETASEGGEFQECMQSLRGLNREYGTLPVDDESLRCIWSHYKCRKEQVDMLEKETRGQSVCPLWFEHRKGRITGTKAHDVFVMKESSNTDNLVRLITGSKCPRVKAGIERKQLRAAISSPIRKLLSANTKSPYSSKSKKPLLIVTTLSDVRPPNAFEMNDIEPNGVIATRYFNVL
ncbi:hypothetical protein DPMN_050200 [Dreissena polymorpha]|uniref:Uncharacterized protein n=1 Tax=Dreissena polymorpha TaxID=45954 RepID=A0A9D4CFN9_DREPO|nr:hypothetical protein DPMN_050200 [Dreissena polymorpha]